MSSGKCILLDRDGVLNKELGDYVYHEDDFIVQPGVPEGLRQLKAAGFFLVVVTNQGGISKGLYSAKTMWKCHQKLQEACGFAIDHFLYAPWHKDQSKSLSAKPGNLMIQRGLALANSGINGSWLIGDAERDLVAAKSLHLKTILIPTLKEQTSPLADFVVPDFKTAVQTIIQSIKSN